MSGTVSKSLSFVGAMKIARQPHGFASTPMNGKTSPAHAKPKNHPPADKTSSGRVIDIMVGVSRLPP